MSGPADETSASQINISLLKITGQEPDIGNHYCDQISSFPLIFSSYGCPLALKLACSRTFEIVCTRLGDNAILLLATNQEWWLLAKEPPGGQAAPI